MFYNLSKIRDIIFKFFQQSFRFLNLNQFLQHSKKIWTIVFWMILLHVTFAEGFGSYHTNDDNQLIKTDENGENARIDSRIDQLKSSIWSLENKLAATENKFAIGDDGYYFNDNYDNVYFSGYGYNNNHNYSGYNSYSNDNSEMYGMLEKLQQQVKELQNMIDQIDANFSNFDFRISQLEKQQYSGYQPQIRQGSWSSSKIPLIAGKSNSSPNVITLAPKANNDNRIASDQEKLMKKAEIERENINRILNSIDEQLTSSMRSEKKITPTNPENRQFDESEEYRKAFLLLRNTYKGNKNFTNTRYAFSKFIQNYPQSIMLGNAYYWMAETYMYDQKYNYAAIQYLKGYQAPANERTLDNLMGLSNALFKLGKYQQVCAVIIQIGKEKDQPTISMQREIETLVTKAGCGS